MERTDPNMEKGSSKVNAAVTGEKERERNGQRLDSSFHDNLSHSTPTAQQAPGARKCAATRI
jgi:hypothetical protein